MAGLHYVKRYQARHTAATLQLKQSGQDVAVVAENLGDTDPTFTMRTYTYPLEETEKALARQMDALLGS